MTPEQIIRDFLAKHNADEIQWDAIDRIEERGQLFNNVRQWGRDRNITGPDGKGTLLGQLSKTQEELTETRDAAVEGSTLGWPPHQKRKFKDGIGDTMVTLILAAEMAGFTAEECLQAAYDEIKGRTGKMVGGVFVKDKPKTSKAVSVYA